MSLVNKEDKNQQVQDHSIAELTQNLQIQWDGIHAKEYSPRAIKGKMYLVEF